MLPTAAKAVTLFVAFAHAGFFVLESVLWSTPTGRKVFGKLAADPATKVLAANQGVYNGALAVALAWAALTDWRDTAIMLLLFVVVVGVYGGLTAKRSILVVQALPAAVALALAFV
jgi:putative membrane protein